MRAGKAWRILEELLGKKSRRVQDSSSILETIRIAKYAGRYHTARALQYGTTLQEEPSNGEHPFSIDAFNKMEKKASAYAGMVARRTAGGGEALRNNEMLDGKMYHQ